MDKKIKQNLKAESSAEPQLKEASPVKWVSFWESRENLLFLSAILIISFMVYLPSLQNGFVNWDDPVFIYENPYILNISGWGDLPANVKGIFTPGENLSYKPLVMLSFAFEKVLFGLESPGWWHLDNIILHLICVFLVFRIALALELKIIPAAFCALLFGIHPMRVESVAWITERKDVLYGTFYFLALYYYIKSVKLAFRKRYLLIILTSFILALLSKIQAVTLPLSMLLVDYYFGRRLSLKLVYEKWPYFLLSLIRGIAGIFILSGIIADYYSFSVFERIFIGSFTYCVYLIKSVVPYKMVPFNPFPDKIYLIHYVSILLSLTILCSTVYFYLKKYKVFVFSILFFTFNVMFVLQITNGGPNFLVDRYTYIAYFGLFFIFAFGLNLVLGKYGKFDKLIYITAFIILGIYGYLNFEQNKIWENGETLWSHVLKHYPGSITAWTNRAEFYYGEERLKEAIHDFSRAIDLHPFDAKIILNRGAAYAQLNFLDKALIDYNKAEKIDPTIPEIYKYKAIISSNLGDYNKAQSELEKYLVLKPNDSDMWSNFGILYMMNNQYEKSLNSLNNAIQINPNNLIYYSTRLKIYYEMGDIQRARNDLYFLKSQGFKGINPEYERLLNQGM